MSTHVDSTALRNVCLKISKQGSNTNQYRILRQILLEGSSHLRRFIPSFIVSCESPADVRSYLSTFEPNNEQRTAYGRRRHFLEQEFAELIYWSERDVLLPVEIDSFQLAFCADRATVDDVLRLMRDCVESDPRRSILVSRHAVLDSASYLLYANDVCLNVKENVQQLLEQIIQMAEHPAVDQAIHFSPDRPFVASIMPLAQYIDWQYNYFSWEESNRKPEYPTIHTARHFCQAATLLCEVFWQWTFDDTCP